MEMSKFAKKKKDTTLNNAFGQIHVDSYSYQE